MAVLPQSASRATFGPFEVDASTRALLKHGVRIRLSGQPLRILLILLARPGALITREQLRQEVWGEETFVDFEHGLNAAVNKLRSALSDSAENPRYIETVPGRGYQFIAEVALVPGQEAPRNASPLIESEGEALAGQPPLMNTMLVQRVGGFGTGDDPGSASVTLPALDGSVEPVLGAQALVCAQSDRVAGQWKKWAVLVCGVVLLAGLGWLTAAWSKSRALPTRPQVIVAPPVIVLMDTTAPMGVYDPNTRKNSGSNADDISDELRDLPVALHKENLSSVWDREDQVLRQNPALIVMHRSAFFHAMNLDFQLGYPPFSDSSASKKGQQPSRLELFIHLLQAAQNRMEAFLGYAGSTNPKTRFLIYSRGMPREWSEAAYRRDWTQNVERRFPVLQGRVFTLNVEGGEDGRIRDPVTVAHLRQSVESILGLAPSRAKK